MRLTDKKIVWLCCGILVLIVFFNFLFIQLLLFDVFPYAGIVFHLAGGIAFGIGAYYLFLLHLVGLPWYIIVCFIIGAVGLAAIGWEGFEWTFSQFYYNNLQGSLDNTMGDLCVGLLGGCIAAGWVVFRKRTAPKTVE